MTIEILEKHHKNNNKDSINEKTVIIIKTLILKIKIITITISISITDFGCLVGGDTGH